MLIFWSNKLVGANFYAFCNSGKESKQVRRRHQDDDDDRGHDHEGHQAQF